MTEAIPRVRWINRRKYERAQELIRSGGWIANPDDGTLHTRRTGRRIGYKSGGYLRAGLRLPETGLDTTVLLHRVLWEVVHGPIPDGLEINHKDGDKSNCRLSNLEAITHLQNVRHAHSTGLWSRAVIGQPVAEEIAAALDAGESKRSISKRFSVAHDTIVKIDQSRPTPRGSRVTARERGEKTCTSCLVVKPLDQFYRRKSGWRHHCKPCGLLSQRERRSQRSRERDC